ncbi:hypothetical protein ACWEPC_22395 [Nonomuraea sp. NPDC004297]
MHIKHVVLDAHPRNGTLRELGVDDVGGPRSASLLRPYLDLGPHLPGPSFVTSVESAFRQLADPDSPRLMIQTHPPVRLREILVKEIGLPAYGIRLAAELPERLRTDRWRVLLEHIAAAARSRGLTMEQRLRLATLLNTLGLYDDTAHLFPQAADGVGSADPVAATLAIRFAMAVHRTRRSQDAERFNLRALREAAENPAGDPYVRLGATTTLVAWFAKGRQRDLDQVQHWRSVAEGLYPSLDPDSGMPDVLHASTYWRAISFGRYVRGDFAGTAEELDLAERHARAFRPADEAERLVWAQNMHPLLETRTREAFDAGDLPLAKRRAAQLLDMDPLCAKAHGHMGNVCLARGEVAEARTSFRTAVGLGAPYTAFAWFMLGHCAELLGDRREAQQAWVEAIRSDPGGIEIRRRLSALGEVPGPVGGFVAEWAATSAADIITRLRTAHAARAGRPAPEGVLA